MSYTDAKAVQERVQEHYDRVISLGYEVVGVFLQGSWNYGLGWEESDVDTKAIVLPTFEEIALGRRPVSTTYIMENGEHIDLKDIRLMFNCFKKQNINFIEILFTPWFVMNPKYKHEFQWMFDNRDKIASYDVNRLISCIKGNLFNETSRMFKETPGTERNMSLYGCDVKSLSHIIRYMDFFKSYIVDKKSYSISLIPSRINYIMRFKRGDFHSWEVWEVLKELDKFYEEMEIVHKQKFTEEIDYAEEFENRRDWICRQFDSVLLSIFEKEFKSYMFSTERN